MATYLIGDVQGCFLTLERLLRRIGFDPREDRALLVGDLVNRGPRSAEVLRWAIGLGESVYVHAGASRSTWVENMETDPKVRLRVDDSIYELVAARVEGQDEFDRFSDAYEKKYGRRPRNEKIAEVYLFRLTAP